MDPTKPHAKSIFDRVPPWPAFCKAYAPMNSLPILPTNILLLGLGFTVSCHVSSDLNEGGAVGVDSASQERLIAHWPLNEGKDTIVHDTTGQHPGKIRGATWTSDGLLRFDGRDDYIPIRPSVEVSGQTLTISARFSSEDLANCETNDCRIISRSTGVQTYEHDFMLSTIRIKTVTRLRFRLRINGRTKTLIAYTGDLRDNETVHAAAVYDGSYMRLYKNGNAVGRLAITGDITTTPDAATWIGGNPPGPTDRPWMGHIHDLRIYGRALSSDEIASLAAGNVGETPVDPGNTDGTDGNTGGTGETDGNTDGTGETDGNTDGTGETDSNADGTDGNTDGTGETDGNTGETDGNTGETDGNTDGTDGNPNVEEPLPGPNHPPVATDASFTTSENTPVNITLSATDKDNDTLIFRDVSQPQAGALSGAGQNLVYTPGPSFVGMDKFDFRVEDEDGATDVGTITITVERPQTSTPGRVTAIAKAMHPNLYFNQKEITKMRAAIKNRTAPSAALAAWSRIASANAVGKPSTLKTNLGWHATYKIAQPLSKKNMEAAMSYMIEPTDSKANAMKNALLSWTQLKGEGSNWARGCQTGGHMQYPLAWMYDLLYNAGVLSETEKDQVDAYMQKYARTLTIKRHGVLFGIDEQGKAVRDSNGQILKDRDLLMKQPPSVRIGYDNFYTLDQTAGLVFAMVSHSQAAVDRIFETDVSNSNYGINDPAFEKGHIRSFRNLIEGEVYPNGYTYDGYKRQYGFNTTTGFNGEDKGDGQHYHFFALMGFIAAAEASAHNGFDAWAYKNNRLVQGFITGAAWAHTAYRVADPGNRNHSPLYWMILRRYPDNQTIKDVVGRSESRATYSYFFSNVGPIWSVGR